MSCPICAKPAQERFRPFCSRGCADRDLLNWLDGRYVAPAGDEGDLPEADAPLDHCPLQ